MISSVIRRVLFLSIALLLLVSCSRGGEKADAGKTKAPESAPKSVVTVTTAVSSTPKAAKTSKAASATRKETGDYNGITQFGDR